MALSIRLFLGDENDTHKCLYITRLDLEKAFVVWEHSKLLGDLRVCGETGKIITTHHSARTATPAHRGQKLDCLRIELLEADAIGLDKLGLPGSTCFVQLAPVREGLLDVQGTTAATPVTPATPATPATAAASAVSTIPPAEVVRQLVTTCVLFVQLAVRRARQVELGAHLDGECALERLEHHPHQHRHIDQHDALDAHGVAANVQ